MNIYLVGCERAGKTTLAGEIMKWAEKAMGGTSHFHDHMTVPSSEFTPEGAASYRQAHPQVIESLQRYMLSYHISDNFFSNRDHNLMGHAIEEAVYAPLYYGYGGEESQAPFRSSAGQRTQMARKMEKEMLKRAPNIILTLLKADAEVIRGRIREREEGAPGDPHSGVVTEADVDTVLSRFEEEFAASLLPNKIILDTTAATVSETLDEFLEQAKPCFSDADRERLATG